MKVVFFLLSLFYSSLMVSQSAATTESSFHLRSDLATPDEDNVLDDEDHSIERRGKKLPTDDNVYFATEVTLLGLEGGTEDAFPEEVYLNAVADAFPVAFGRKWHPSLQFIDRQRSRPIVEATGPVVDGEEPNLQYSYGQLVTGYHLGDPSCRWCPPDDDSLGESDMQEFSFEDMLEGPVYNRIKTAFENGITNSLHKSGLAFFENVKVSIQFLGLADQLIEPITLDNESLALSQGDDDHFVSKIRDGLVILYGVGIMDGPGVAPERIVTTYMEAYNTVFARTPIQAVAIEVDPEIDVPLPFRSDLADVFLPLKITFECTGDPMCFVLNPYPRSWLKRQLLERYFCKLLKSELFVANTVTGCVLEIYDQDGWEPGLMTDSMGAAETKVE